MPKITMTQGPVNTASGTNPSPSSQTRTAAVIAKLQAANSQESPVVNPSKVSPEEMSASTTGQVDDIDPATPAEETAQVAETPAKPEVSEEDKQLSSRYAQLARQEKILRAKAAEQQAKMKAMEESLAAREAALTSNKAPEAPKTISLDDLLADPLSILEQHGIDYDKLTERAMQPKTDPVVKSYLAKLEARIAEQDAKIKSFNDAQEEQKTGAYKQAINQIANETKRLVDKDPEFETIKETGGYQEVVELIERTYKEGIEGHYEAGTILDVATAARMVEEDLAERLYNYASKVNKVKTRFQPVAPATPAKSPAEEDSKQPQQTLKTLTNAHGTTRQLSAKERALLAFRGELKK